MGDEVERRLLAMAQGPLCEKCFSKTAVLTCVGPADSDRGRLKSGECAECHAPMWMKGYEMATILGLLTFPYHNGLGVVVPEKSDVGTK